MSVGIQVGCTGHMADGIADSICKILDAIGRNSLGDNTSIATMRAFAKATQVRNVSISNCNVGMFDKPDNCAAPPPTKRRTRRTSKR